MKKVSVVIPVWNTEKYIKECLDSILAQSIIDELEIICVNDGSTDTSLEILRKYDKLTKILFLEKICLQYCLKAIKIIIGRFMTGRL